MPCSRKDVAFAMSFIDVFNERGNVTIRPKRGAVRASGLARLIGGCGVDGALLQPCQYRRCTIAVSSNTATMIAQCRSALTETTVRYFSIIACRYLMLQKGSV